MLSKQYRDRPKAIYGNSVFLQIYVSGSVLLVVFPKPLYFLPFSMSHQVFPSTPPLIIYTHTHNRAAFVFFKCYPPPLLLNPLFTGKIM